MKTLPLVIGSVVGLTALLSPVSVRAEETAPAQPSASSGPTSGDLAAKLLADLLKQASSTGTDSTAAAAAPADAQTQELQTLLIGVLKTIAQMLPKFLAALDSTQNGSDTPFNVNLEEFLNGAAATAPAKKLREVGLHSTGLKTFGLSPDGSSASLADEDWKKQFQKREPAR